MQLSDYFDKENIGRNASFTYTMFPSTTLQDSICYALKDVYIQKASDNPNISAIITTKELGGFVNQTKGLVTVENPEETYYRLHNFIIEQSKSKLVNSLIISDKASIASSVIIGQNVIIEEGVEIAERAIINNNSVIKKNTYIGENVVIGARGMQNIHIQNKWFNIHFGGGVIIGENCEILANAIVQKPYHFFFTTIGNNTKISVKVSVGHGSNIGKNCMLAGNTTIAGNVKIGDNVWIGPSVTVADNIEIGSDAQVVIGSVVVNNVAQKKIVSGNFALDHSKRLKHFAKLRKL